MKHIKRWLFLIHRWTGIVACAFFAMWFLSGVVMMYVGYPKLTHAERLLHLPPLEASTVRLTPRQALAAAGIDGPLRELRLAAASGGRPVYLATPAGAGRHGGAIVVDAADGSVLRHADPRRALASAAAYAGGGVALAYEGTLAEDAFTHSRALDAHRPLHRVALGDAAGTRLYISGSTGEVVRDATRSERGWNYAGAWIHWLYPFRGNVFDRYWSDIVNGLSLLGIAAVIAGTVVGLLRWRFRGTYKRGTRTPYAGRMMRWHHISGLLFALVTLTWIFSGLMSMNPWKLFDSGAPALRTEAMNGGPLRLPADAAEVPRLLAAAGGTVRELRWVRAAGRDLVLAENLGGAPRVLDASRADAAALDEAQLRQAAARLVDAPVQRIETLRAYDTHYYARAEHTMTGGGEKPLPVLRIVFDDPHATWVHVDPHTGAVLGRSDSARRASRWLFAMLHSWDWLPLLERRPLWDALLVLASAGGALLSLTGVVIGWRRLGHTLRRGARRPRRLQSPTSAR